MLKKWYVKEDQRHSRNNVPGVQCEDGRNQHVKVLAGKTSSVVSLQSNSYLIIHSLTFQKSNSKSYRHTAG